VFFDTGVGHGSVAKEFLKLSMGNKIVEITGLKAKVLQPERAKLSQLTRVL
jgi:hypothetical protein